MSVTPRVPGEPPAPPGWYAWLLAGVTPILLLGFLASAVADRLAFLAWALLAAFAYALTLKRAFGRRRVPAVVVLALGWGAFALLAARHREALALGIAALLPAEAAP